MGSMTKRIRRNIVENAIGDRGGYGRSHHRGHVDKFGGLLKGTPRHKSKNKKVIKPEGIMAKLMKHVLPKKIG
jgi:hypothetical protein